MFAVTCSIALWGVLRYLTPPMSRQNIIDKSVPIDDGNENGTLEADLLKVGKALQLLRDMTLGYAIHILASADENSANAENVHTKRVLGVIEQFRQRIYLVSKGRVQPPPKAKVARDPTPQTAHSNGAVRSGKTADIPASDAIVPSPVISAVSEPLSAAPLQLPENCKEWTPVQILQFLDVVENRTDKAHGSLAKIFCMYEVSRSKYRYWVKTRVTLELKAGRVTAVMFSVAERSLPDIAEVQSATVSVSTHPELVERTEDERKKYFIIAVSLQIAGSVKTWTYEEALDKICDHYIGIFSKILEYDPEFAESRDLLFQERRELGSRALRTLADRYDPLKDGDLTSFLQQGVRAEFRKNPLLCTPKDPQSRDAMALLWASKHLREEAYDFHEFVGVMIHQHLAWVSSLVMSLHDPKGAVPLKALRNAGYQELQRGIKGFDFTDDVTYDSFKGAMKERVRAAIVDCANGAPQL